MKILCKRIKNFKQIKTDHSVADNILKKVLYITKSNGSQSKNNRKISFRFILRKNHRYPNRNTATNIDVLKL